MDYKDYYNKIKAAESGGNRFAKNPFPNQTASGIFQFTKGTWTDLGFDWKDRFDVDKQYQAVEKLTKGNANYFKKNFKKDPTYADLYGMHWLGAAGYKRLYTAKDNDLISSVMSAEEIAVNPSYTKNKDGSLKTVAEVRNILRKKTGDGVVNTTTQTQQETPYVPLDLNLPEMTGMTFTEEEKETEEKPQVNKREENANKLSFISDVKELQRQQQEQAYQPPRFLEQQLVEGVAYQPIQQNFQDGGIKVDPQGYWNPDNLGNPVVIPSPSISMKNVDFAVLGTSVETGEQKLMQPNKNYFFKNTSNVLEQPLYQDGGVAEDKKFIEDWYTNRKTILDENSQPVAVSV